MQPRIYTYKITFEEVPYWYWGVHKERKYGETYLGSPKTHKWAWDFYTPLIQVLEFFPYTEEGWKEARSVEDRLILPDFNNPLCLNEGVGGLKSCRVSQINGLNNRALKRGIFDPSYVDSPRYLEDKSAAGKRSAELKLGIHDPDYRESPGFLEVRIESGKQAHRLQTGIHDPDFILAKLCRPIRITLPDGSWQDYPSVQEASKSVGARNGTLARAARRGTPITRGRWKGVRADYV